MAETFGRNYYEPWLKHIEQEKWLDTVTSDMTCQEALVRAYMAVPEGHAATRSVLRMMIKQKGLEHLGTDCPDGRLTTYMDTVIFG